MDKCIETLRSQAWRMLVMAPLIYGHQIMGKVLINQGSWVPNFETHMLERGSLRWHVKKECMLKTQEIRCQLIESLSQGINWLVDWRIGWLIEWLVCLLMDSLGGWLVDWVIEWVRKWVSQWVVGWLIEQSCWFTEWSKDWLSGIVSGQQDLAPVEPLISLILVE